MPRITLDFETPDDEVTKSVITVLENTLPYMADNVSITPGEPSLSSALVSMAVSEGVLDDHLDNLRNVINLRRQRLANLLANSLQPGDEFYIKDCKPAYLNGERVKFLHTGDGGKLVCRLMTNPGGSRFSQDDKIILSNAHVGERIQ